MDFGENLKRAREEKGLTQQHLADELYVTRQAVSKWECGTRYPDLLTTKCIANILGVTIDSLVSNDEMQEFAQKQSIVQGQRGEKIISSLYAIIILLSTVELIQKVIGVATQFELLKTDVDKQIFLTLTLQMVFCVSVFNLSISAFFKSLANKLNPKEAGRIGMCFFGYYAVNGFSHMLFNKQIWQMVLFLTFTVFAVIIIDEYFLRNKSVLYKPLILLCIISTLYLTGATAYVLFSLAMQEQYALTLSNTLIFFRDIAFVGIMLFQAIILERKRKLCKKVM